MLFMSTEPGQVAASDKPSPPEDTTPSITFETITFSDGTQIPLDLNDIVVLAGPNNSGKSVALNELQRSIGEIVDQMVIKTVSLRKLGTGAQLRKLLDQHGQITGRPGQEVYRGFQFSVASNSVEDFWERNVRQLRDIFCTRIATETRITDSNAQGAIPILDAPPTHPIHILYMNDDVERQISFYFRQAFGEDLIVFHAGGSSWPLLVGNRPKPLQNEDRVTRSYNTRLRNTTVPLQQQGDGMRSFASVVLHLLAPGTQTILLLDEPEAFLHPPQARLLGEFIAKEKPPGAQLFIATHSPDVLQGLLNVTPEHLRVIRIQREGMINHVKELDKAQAIEISTDPLMKYSSVLSGIFYQRVIICEADADCMFYSTLLDLPEVHGNQRPDVLFVHAGGKHRMAKLADALRALDVPVDVIADMDVLNDEVVIGLLVSTLGGDWPTIRAEYLPLKTAIEQHKPWLNSGEVAKGIKQVLEKAPSTGEFPGSLRSEIFALFRKASPWDAIKDAGEAAIPSGQAMKHYEKLQQLCTECGLWIVPVGELEGFCKLEGGHGPRFVQDVIENYDLAKDPKLAAARDFVRNVWING